MRYSVEKIKFEQSPLLSQATLTITGWAFLPEDNAIHNEVQVVLQSNKTTYVFTTQKQIRNDVTVAFESEKYNYSGFEAYIPKPAIDPGSYKIGIMVKRGGKQVYKETPKFFELIDSEAVTKPFDKREVTYAIDSIGDLGDHIYLKGWAFIAGVDSKDTQIRLMLESPEGQLGFVTVPASRPDVTAGYSWQRTNYDQSGFTIQIPKKDLKPGIYLIKIAVAAKGAVEMSKETPYVVTIR
jgi:hypothetical protein